MTHGMCSVHGCGQTQVIKAGAPAPPRRLSGPLRKVALAGAAVLLAGLGALGGVAAWRAGLVPGSPSGLNEADEEALRPVVPTDPAVLREAEVRTAALDAERERARARLEALRGELRAQEVTLDIDQVPFGECIDALRELTGWNIVVSGDAQHLVDVEHVTVSVKLRNISCEATLQVVLACHEQLTFRVDEPRLIRIETRSEEEAELRLEVYDIADILSGATRAKGGFQVDADELIELLELVRGDRESGGSADVSGDVLILRRAHEDHEQARELLRYLRGDKSRENGGRPAWIDDLEKKLEKRVSLDFRDTHLGDVVSQLQELSGADIFIGRQVDVDDEETRVFLRVKDVSLKDALKLILEQTRLGSRYRDEALFLCPPEELHDPCTLRILDVRDLGWMSADTLEQAIRNATGPARWDAPASIRLHRDQLIVYQTPAMHEAIDEVVAKLRLGHARNLESSGKR